ncbi:hypothetical protein ACQKMD_16295 [Viridibacillus sp. NPDC096237]|uniref:hypothetical protein n=1 Tax=Viridibacillus sp. NPDC096237 TaxID=3390721 RepID=UPI003D00ADAC
MKDVNTAVFFTVLGISLFVFSIVAPIQSPVVRVIIFLLCIQFIYRSLRIFSSKEYKKRKVLN